MFRCVLNRHEDRHGRFELGPTLLAEKLVRENLVVDHETLRRRLIQEGHWKKKRKRNQHRSRRERRKHFGELVEMGPVGRPVRGFGDWRFGRLKRREIVGA